MDTTKRYPGEWNSFEVHTIMKRVVAWFVLPLAFANFFDVDSPQITSDRCLVSELSQLLQRLHVAPQIGRKGTSRYRWLI